LTVVKLLLFILQHYWMYKDCCTVVGIIILKNKSLT